MDALRIYIELEGVGKVAPANIVARFLEWSIEVRIYNYNGKNLVFAVPKTQCLLRPA
jgi:hypothetical protein